MVERHWTCPNCGTELERPSERTTASAWNSMKEEHREQCNHTNNHSNQ